MTTQPSTALPETVRINAPNVVSEQFEREIVVVNLETGCYFSLLGSAPTIWQALEQGPTPIDQLIHAITLAHDCSGVDAHPMIINLLHELLNQNLIIASEPPETPITTTELCPHASTLFEPPILEVFTDLQDILLLDPIHDVDEAGWPVAAPPA